MKKITFIKLLTVLIVSLMTVTASAQQHRSLTKVYVSCIVKKHVTIFTKAQLDSVFKYNAQGYKSFEVIDYGTHATFVLAK